MKHKHGRHWRLARPIAPIWAMLFTLLAQPTAGAEDRFWPDWQPRTDSTYVVRQVLSPISSAMDVEVIDIETGEVSTLASTSAWEGSADIDGGWVVWLERPDATRHSCDVRIMAQALDAAEPVVIAGGLIEPTAPRISGRKVVWGSYEGRCSQDSAIPSRTGQFSLAVFDLGTMKQVEQLGPWDGSVFTPALYDDHLVWAQRPGGWGPTTGKLFSYRLGSETVPREVGIALEDNYDVSDNAIAYVDNSEQLVIVSVDGINTRIAANGQISHPTIDGRYVAWDAYAEGQMRLYGLDMATGQRFDLDGGEFAHQPHLRNNVLVWQAESVLRGGVTIRTATIEDFEQLHRERTRDEWTELLLWGGIALIALVAVGALWRYRGLRQPQVSLSPPRP